MLITSEKIEEWIKEIESRPESATLIIQFIANRLQDLTLRNEALLEDNISLQSGKRVLEYEQRISHLDYELELLKRHFQDSKAVGLIEPDGIQTGSPGQRESKNIILYDKLGRILRFDLTGIQLGNLEKIGRVSYISDKTSESLRLLVSSSNEEIMWVFTSGRVDTFPVANIPAVQYNTPMSDLNLKWNAAIAPIELRAGENLACLMPISKMALADHFILVSRRGVIKKINTILSQSIFQNHYIGSAARQHSDQTFFCDLCCKDDFLYLISNNGYLQRIPVKDISYSLEEGIRLETNDHLVKALIVRNSPKQVAAQTRMILVMTNTGKGIFFEDRKTELNYSPKSKGQPVFSQKRRQTGVQAISAAEMIEDGWAFTLQQDGSLSLHSLADLFASGVIQVDSPLVAFETFHL